jgi:peptidoglycan/xylan/chitin deacetylase (PgdA/CDA1 family)
MGSRGRKKGAEMQGDRGGHERRSVTGRALDLMFRLGVFDAVHAAHPRRLTAINYHRVDDPHRADFDTFKPNVSATPDAFAAQMDYVRRRFNVVSIGEVAAWLKGDGDLPPYPALITFDDGYRDNLTNAYPILKARDLPAVIFLASDYIGSASPFLWDLAAYCFHHTGRDGAELPVSGARTWAGAGSREVVMMEWLETLKAFPDGEMREAVGRLPDLLDVAVPESAFAELHLTWDQVRELVAGGIDMGAHTMSHPILTRVSPERAREEVAGSKWRVEAETGGPVVGFAYPNGQAADFSPAIGAMVRESGFGAAFSLVMGPTSYREARRSPMAIRRVFVGRWDTLPRFAAKVSGFQRLVGLPR